MSEIIIKTEGLSFSYDEDDGSRLAVLENFDIEIEKGTFVALLGHNGSGKSTLAKLFNLILSPTAGSLWLFGEKIDEENMTEDDLFALRQRVGMVFQNPDKQLVATIVEEDVAFGPENLGVPSKEIRERVDKALELVGMTKFARHSPHQLSGGQKQRIAIAGIIAMEPDCIVLDEPTAMLDPVGRREIMETVKKLNHDEGMTVVMITHYMEEAAMADRVIVMDHGKSIIEGTPKEVFSKVEKIKKIGLDVPQTTELCFQLQMSGLDFDTNILTVDECVDKILSVYNARGGVTND